MRRKVSQAFLNASHRKKFENQCVRQFILMARMKRRLIKLEIFGSNLIPKKLALVAFNCAFVTHEVVLFQVAGISLSCGAELVVLFFKV